MGRRVDLDQNWSRDSYTLYRVDPATGAIQSRCSMLELNSGHPAITSYPISISTEPDGLAFDGEALWVSAGAYTGNWVARVDRSCKILNAWQAPSGLGWSNAIFSGASGIAFDGAALWHATPDDGRTRSLYFQTTGNGARTGVSFTAGRMAAALAWDPVTFAPKCALWSIEASDDKQHITAVEAPCTRRSAYRPLEKPCDVNGDGLINLDDIRAIVAAAGIAAADLDARDGDGDGAITVKDARSCAIRCSKANCGLWVLICARSSSSVF